MLSKLRQIPIELRSGQPLRVGKALTKSFLIVILILAILPQHTVESGWQLRFWAFLLSPPNEIGDTLAGIAGVLAFLWIIITVWLQSIELKEQRKELQATRIEIKLTRETQQEQLAAFKAQGAIFLDEQQQRQEVKARQLLDERVALLASMMSFYYDDTFLIAGTGRHFQGKGYKLVSGSTEDGLKVSIFPAQEGRSPQDEIYQASLYFEDLISVLKKIVDQNHLIKRSDGKLSLLAVRKLLEEIVISKGSLAEADQYILDRIRVAETFLYTGQLLDLTIWEEGP